MPGQNASSSQPGLIGSARPTAASRAQSRSLGCISTPGDTYFLLCDALKRLWRSKVAHEQGQRVAWSIGRQMAEHKLRGNALFQSGDFAAAAAAYTEGLSVAAPREHPLTCVLLSNRAACALHLGDAAAAEADCRAGLLLSPVHPKLNYRLARALAAQGHASKAAAAMGSAVALLPAARSGELLALYAEVAAAAAEEASSAEAAGDPKALLQLPRDPARVALASSARELFSAMRGSAAQLVVLMPGTYDMPDATLTASFSLLGLGSVHLRGLSSHAIFSEGGDVTLVNMRLSGGGRRAAVCVAPALRAPATLRMVGCSVVDYPEGGGLLVHGGSALLEGCTFVRCGSMGIEVRQGGSLSARNTRVEECRQGISAYGGARRVRLRGCAVLRCSDEGILASGSSENAASAAQSQVVQENLGPRDPSAARATEEAKAWGKRQQAELQVALADCQVSHNGSFGLSLDSGCRATVSRCRLEGNDPYAMFVKGGTDVCITACQFVFHGGSSAKSAWAKRVGKGKLKLAGARGLRNMRRCAQGYNCTRLVAGFAATEVAATDAYPPSQPVSPPSQPVSSPSQPLSPPSQPVSPPSQPVSPPSQPVSPPSQPVSPPSQPVSPPTCLGSLPYATCMPCWHARACLMAAAVMYKPGAERHLIMSSVTKVARPGRCVDAMVLAFPNPTNASPDNCTQHRRWSC
jgi:hypothetical protein